MNLFPMIQPELELKDASLPMYKEIAWDFEHNIPIYKNGSPKWITGKEAVLVWAWKALHVQKYSYPLRMSVRIINWTNSIGRIETE